MTTPGNTTARGYGYHHQQRRKQLLIAALGTPCPYCRQPMLPGQTLDLDHSQPLAHGGTIGDRIAHSHCNRSAGGRIGNARARARANTVPQLKTSQQW